ncbi:hypothetical protein [Legionella pneumophila]|uniref:Uncharacterized protein n=1 Tax=Legionella pneumophila (strain Lens) TaxID=297245 RepID=Q5WU63_LEGPL|nr:hypothetical protein lpl2308 [Legionella pneumophila str. Lens]HAT9031201.1 hypothetical protein [Legionella pneumophila subsp. pneumophila]
MSIELLSDTSKIISTVLLAVTGNSYKIALTPKNFSDSASEAWYVVNAHEANPLLSHRTESP